MWLLPAGARPVLGWAAPLARLAAALAVVLLLMGGTVVASAGSLPEEPLYHVKLAAEGAQLALVSNPQARVELELQFATRRLSEVESAALLGRTEAIERGLVLYQERVESVLRSARALAEPTEGEGAEREEQWLRQSLERQQAVLARVHELAPAQAQPALLRAMEVSRPDRARPDAGGAASASGGEFRATPTMGATAAPGKVPTTSPSATRQTVGAHEAQGAARSRTTPAAPHGEAVGKDRGEEGEKERGRAQVPPTQPPATVGLPLAATVSAAGSTAAPERAGAGRDGDKPGRDGEPVGRAGATTTVPPEATRPSGQPGREEESGHAPAKGQGATAAKPTLPADQTRAGNGKDGQDEPPRHSEPQVRSAPRPTPLPQAGIAATPRPTQTATPRSTQTATPEPSGTATPAPEPTSPTPPRAMSTPEPGETLSPGQEHRETSPPGQERRQNARAGESGGTETVAPPLPGPVRPAPAQVEPPSHSPRAGDERSSEPARSAEPGSPAGPPDANRGKSGKGE